MQLYAWASLSIRRYMHTQISSTQSHSAVQTLLKVKLRRDSDHFSPNLCILMLKTTWTSLTEAVSNSIFKLFLVSCSFMKKILSKSWKLYICTCFTLKHNKKNTKTILKTWFSPQGVLKIYHWTLEFIFILLSWNGFTIGICHWQAWHNKPKTLVVLAGLLTVIKRALQYD